MYDDIDKLQLLYENIIQFSQPAVFLALEEEGEVWETDLVPYPLKEPIHLRSYSISDLPVPYPNLFNDLTDDNIDDSHYSQKSALNIDWMKKNKNSLSILDTIQPDEFKNEIIPGLFYVHHMVAFPNNCEDGQCNTTSALMHYVLITSEAKIYSNVVKYHKYLDDTNTDEMPGDYYVTLLSTIYGAIGIS